VLPTLPIHYREVVSSAIYAQFKLIKLMAGMIIIAVDHTLAIMLAGRVLGLEGFCSQSG
jgi:hypothetical protein